MASQHRREFSEALRLNPRLTTAYFNLGMLEFADGHFDEAEQLFKQALTRDPTHQTAYVQLGNLDVKQGKFAATLHVLGPALMLKPRDARTLFNLGFQEQPAENVR
jgi:tetratricopeptide (TPR) repeat protein